ncbi:MAG: hypothetical protein GY804_07990 [Alphaproteobacteria bacterium]|nr:hypothetical protein [Alphaproteobacteria bacterium]
MVTDILSGGFFRGKKTYITAAVGVFTAVGSYLVGDMVLPELIQTIFPLLGMIFVRKGVKDDLVRMEDAE